jgi:putative transposase
MSDATFYNWRSKYGGMDVSMMKRMKELEEENRRLKKMYAQEKLKAEIVQEALKKSGEAVSMQGDGRAPYFGERELINRVFVLPN